jgi:chorismate-pyruvate lyase
MMQGQKATLIIQQQLLPDEAQRISKWASTNNGLTLRFELGRLDIEVQKGKNNLGKLNLESRMKYLINQDAQGFYSWKEIINA